VCTISSRVVRLCRLAWLVRQLAPALFVLCSSKLESAMEIVLASQSTSMWLAQRVQRRLNSVPLRNHG